MHKKILLVLTFSIMTAIAFSQTTPRGEKALTNPKRAENSAKADVYIQKNRVTDNTQTPVNNKPKTSIKRKRIIKRVPKQ